MEFEKLLKLMKNPEMDNLVVTNERGIAFWNFLITKNESDNFKMIVNHKPGKTQFEKIIHV
jgi:hypothetical protein